MAVSLEEGGARTVASDSRGFAVGAVSGVDRIFCLSHRNIFASSGRAGDPMNFSSADLSTILDRILDTAADNLRVAKILVQLGLDPNNITYDALFNRLLEIFLANITLAN